MQITIDKFKFKTSYTYYWAENEKKNYISLLQLIYFIHRRGCEFHPFVPFISQLNWPREGVENRKFQSRRSFYSFPASVNVSPIAFTKSFLFIWNTYFHNAPPFEITGKTGQGVRHKVLKVKYTYYQFIRSSPVKHITFLLRLASHLLPFTMYSFIYV